MTDKNLYAYCDNNPVMRTDEDGEFWHLVAGAIIGIGTQWIGDIATNIAEGKKGFDILKPTSSVVDYFGAALSGALAASGVGMIGAIVGNAAISSGVYALNQMISGEEIQTSELIINAGIGAFSGLIGGKGADGAKLSGVVKSSKQTLKTAVSPRKIATYTAKIRNAYDTAFEGVIRNFASSAMSRILGGNI